MKHNIYYEGKVQSLTLNENEGPATVGVIEPGQYTFSTTTEEWMSILAGKMKVQFPGKEWIEFSLGQSFTIPKDISFLVEAPFDVAYVCRYR